jgi:hypothetical protein
MTRENEAVLPSYYKMENQVKQRTMHLKSLHSNYLTEAQWEDSNKSLLSYKLQNCFFLIHQVLIIEGCSTHSCHDFCKWYYVYMFVSDYMDLA